MLEKPCWLLVWTSNWQGSETRKKRHQWHKWQSQSKWKYMWPKCFIHSFLVMRWCYFSMGEHTQWREPSLFIVVLFLQCSSLTPCLEDHTISIHFAICDFTEGVMLLFAAPSRKAVPALPIFPHLCILLRPCVIHVYSDQSSAQQTGSGGSGCQPEDRSSCYFGKKCFILLYLLMGSDRWYSSMDNLRVFVGTLRFLTVLHLNGKRSSSTTILGQMKHGIELASIDLG